MLAGQAHSVQAPWGAGTMLGGRYRLVALLGRGAMGEVWCAQHMALGTSVALKLISVAGQQNANELLARFDQEARAAARLQSPYSVRITDYGWEGPIAFLAMELLQGESLAARLERTRTMPPGRVAAIVNEIARALTEAHNLGIVHRDIKPQNIHLSHVEGREIAKLLDFGIAKVASITRAQLHETTSGQILGTPAYMSPEQAMGGKPVDARSDLWQLAIVAFEAMCGRRPLLTESVGQLLIDICTAPMPAPSSLAPVPAGFDAWFARATRRDPKERFASADEMARALTRVIAPTAQRVDGSLAPLSGPLAASSVAHTTTGAMTSRVEVQRKRRTGFVVGALLSTAVGIGIVAVAFSGASETASLPAAELPAKKARPALGDAAPEPEDTEADDTDETAPSPGAEASASASAPAPPSTAPPHPPKGPLPWNKKQPQPTQRPEEILGL